MPRNSVLVDAIYMLLAVVVSIAAAGVCLDWLSMLYTAYRRALMRLDDERWLLENCRDPIFFSKMRAHTTVCGEVEANARVGAFWTALREATDIFKVSWQPCMVWVGAVVVIVLPICWVCVARASTSYCAARRRRMWDESLPSMRESQTCSKF
jgi:hypothetical protein